jgi:hypothetical protein
MRQSGGRHHDFIIVFMIVSKYPPLFFRRLLLGLVLLLAWPGLAAAQDFAPVALKSGDRLTTDGVIRDTVLGTLSKSVVYYMTSASELNDGEGTTGTYTYVKLSPTKAKLTYVTHYAEPGFVADETGTILLTYSSATTGSYTSSGSFEIDFEGEHLSSTFTESGSFHFRPSPEISDIADLSTPELIPVTISFTMGDALTSPDALIVTSSSSNPTLLPLANITLGGTGPNRTATLQPARNQYGTTTITITVGNGGSSSSETFVLTVIADNRPPAISDVPSQFVEKNTTAAIPFIVSDPTSPVDSLTVQFHSFMPSILPQENIVISGTGANRILTVTPAPDQTGLAIVTLTVSDGELNSSKSFFITFTPPTLASWRQTHFSSRENSGAGADLNDFDGDGMANLLEYALGTSPTDPSSVARPAVARDKDGSLTLAITRPADLPGITYEVEVSDNLVNWLKGPSNVTTVENSATTFKVRSWSFSSQKRFIRLAVTSN